LLKSPTSLPVGHVSVFFLACHYAQSIDSLLLNDHGFDDNSFSTFVCVLPTLARCSALVRVNLAGNAIGDVGMAQLADAFEVC
jgi:hypothetical protein